MSGTAALERWYRRLLACFPAEHRRTYADEMIGVLLASAPQGRRRPRFADVVDLIGGGMRARLRRAGGSLDPGWRDALAVFSIVAPAMALGYFVITHAVYLARWPFVDGADFRRWAGGAAVASLLIFLAVGLPPLLALRGLRRTAIADASIPAAALTSLFIWMLVSRGGMAPSRYFGFWLSSLLLVLALALSPGPRHGAKIMTARTWSVIGITIGLAGLVASDLLGLVIGYPAVVTVVTSVLAATIAIAAVGLVLALPRPVGLRLLLLLAIPGLTIVAGQTVGLPFEDAVYRFPLELIYLPTAALVCLFGVLAWRSARRGRATPG